MNSVILVEHLRIDSEGNDHIKTIGVYHTMAEAEAAVDRLKDKPGFKDNPRIVDPEKDDNLSGFYLSQYPLGKDHWEEGFGWDDDEDDA